MESKSYEKMIVCLGDDVRFDFVSKFTSFPLKESLAFKPRDVFIFHGESEQIFEQEDLVIYTKQLPLGRALHVPAWKFHSESCLPIEELKAKKILLFNVFPYGKESILSETNSLVSGIGAIDLEVILYKEKRRFSASDADSEEDAILEASNKYHEYVNKVTVFEEQDYPHELLGITPRLIDGFMNTYKCKLDLLKYELENRFDTWYHSEIQSEVDLYFDILSPEEFEKYLTIFDFKKVKGAADVWEGFSRNFRKIYLYGEYEIMDLLLEFYLEYLNDILGWDRENQRKYMETRLLKCLDKILTHPKQYPVPTTELEYTRLLAKEPMNVEFQQRINNYFLVEAKKEIYEGIHQNIKKVTRKIVVKE